MACNIRRNSGRIGTRSATVAWPAPINLPGPKSRLTPPQTVTPMTSPSYSRLSQVMLLSLLAPSVEAAVIRRIIGSTEPDIRRASALAATGTPLPSIHPPTISGIKLSPGGQIAPSSIETAPSAFCTLAEEAPGRQTSLRTLGIVDLPHGAHLEDHRTLLVSALGASNAMTLRITLSDASSGREPLLQVRASASTGFDYFDGDSQTRF